MLKKKLFTLLNVFIFTLAISGCFGPKPTVPNLPYESTKSPNSLSTLLQLNPLLSQELGKLPEIQDGVSPEEEIALQKIVDLYRSNQQDFNLVFDDIYKIGIPSVRKYCSPLQALFWLALDGKSEELSRLIAQFDLRNLLDTAWVFESENVFNDEQITAIIDGIENDELRNQYREDSKQLPREKISKFLIIDYKRSKRLFSSKSRELIENGLPRKDPRWRDFNDVTDRLNAPELIDYYERNRFRYVDWRSLPSPSVSPEYVFEHNKGECVSITGFTIYCLTKGGYEAREFRVGTYSTYDFHALTFFKVGSMKFVMDNGQPVGTGIKPYDPELYDKYTIIPR